MSRRVPWRRNCPDVVSCRIEEANQSRIYLLRETGPTGFLVKQDGVEKTLKVFLGDLHSCTCCTFMKEKELCIHILWVLLKKFRVPKENAVIFQLSLVEREINEVMRGAYLPTRGTGTNINKGDENPANNREKLNQKEITEEDVCPICQDQLLEKSESLTYCKYGCGNSIHIKCMKVWAEHQRSTGEKITKCPLCRVDFGTFQELMDEFHKSSRKKTRSERQDIHLGASCNKCRSCPITGKCYRCVVCADYHMCHQCFATDHHMHHSFQFRQKSSQRWRPASRITPLPSAVMENLQNREITEHDYDLLLQLDRPLGEHKGMAGHVLSSFPIEVLREHHPLLSGGSSCGICLHGYQPFQCIRKLPCHHLFHRDCIDSWLVNRSTCPLDGESVAAPVQNQDGNALRSLAGVGPPFVSGSGTGKERSLSKGRLLVRRREGHQENSAPVSLPSSFELSGSGITVRDRSRNNSPGEGGSRHLIDYSSTHLIQSNRMASQEHIVFNPLSSGRPPIAPNNTNRRVTLSSDSRKRETTRAAARTREQRSNSMGDLILSATGRAVSIESLTRDATNKNKNGQLMKRKLTAKNSKVSYSDPELARAEPLVASGLAIQLPIV